MPLRDRCATCDLVRPRADPRTASVRELGSARGRPVDGRDARLLPPKGRMGGNPDRPWSGGEALPGTAAYPLRRGSAARTTTGSRDLALVVGRRHVDRREPPLRGDRAAWMVGVLPVQRHPSSRLGQRLVPPLPPFLLVRADRFDQRLLDRAARRSDLVGLDGQATTRARFPSLAARIPGPGPLPARREGVFATVQPVAAPLAGLDPARAATLPRVPGGRRGRVPHAVLLLR